MEIKKPKHKRRKPTLSKRGQFSKDTKFTVYNEQNGLCFMCSRQGSDFHHVHFKSQGGRGVYTNCLLLCRYCHTEVHQKRIMADTLRNHMKALHGANYYKDGWDLDE